MKNIVDINEVKNKEQNEENITVLPIKKQISIFLIGFLGIYLITFVTEFLGIFAIAISRGKEAIDTLEENPLFLLIVEFFSYLLTLLAILFVVNKDYKKLFIKIKNLKSYFAGFCCALGIIGFEIIYNTILMACGYELVTGGNQEAINEIASSSVVISILVFGIVGPITEELTYRVGLYSLLKRKNKILALLVASFLFGFIHIMSHLFDGNFLNELLLLPIYAGSGFLLTYTYEKYGFVGSCVAHILVNLVSLL